MDYTVHLINNALRLGIPSKKCNSYTITENTILKPLSIASKLKNFEAAFSQIKANRNKILHQGEFEFKSVEEIDSQIVRSDLFDYGEELTEYFNKGRREKIQETIKELKEEVDKVEFHIGEILEELTQFIDTQVKYFELEEKPAANKMQ